MTSAKNASVFLKVIVPIIKIKTLAQSDIKISNQFIGAVCRNAARALWITPAIGFKAKTQEYLPAMLDEYITGVTNRKSCMK